MISITAWIMTHPNRFAFVLLLIWAIWFAHTIYKTIRGED